MFRAEIEIDLLDILDFSFYYLAYCLVFYSTQGFEGGDCGEICKMQIR
jgi:hypothetical protein